MPSSHSGIQPKAALSARAAGSESMATTPRNSAPSSQVASGGMAELPALAVSRENDRLAFVMAAILESGAQLVARASHRLRPAQPGKAGSALWEGFRRELLAGGSDRKRVESGKRVLVRG